MIIAPSPMSSRNEFGKFLTSKGLLGQAVEVGTHRADFAVTLLRSWNGNVLYCIDPWCTPPGYEEQHKRLWGSGNRDADYDLAVNRLSGYGNVLIHRKTSKQAIPVFIEDSLDFVYIDGDHRPQHVLHDLTNWWAKIKPGGILAGHDFLCPGEDDGLWGPGIQLAIQAFFNETQAESNVYVIAEEGGLPWSYYMIKPTKESK